MFHKYIENTDWSMFIILTNQTNRHKCGRSKRGQRGVSDAGAVSANIVNFKMSCLRCSARLLTKSVCSKGSSLSAPFLQQIRGIKPRWLPKSKSKIFYVRKPTLSDPEENKELQTMYNHYRTSVRAVRCGQ